MTAPDPRRTHRLRAWLLLFLALLTWLIHGSLPTLGAGIGPISGSSIAVLVAVGCCIYLYLHRDRSGPGANES